MCGRTNFKRDHACDHVVPLEPCDKYAHELSMCFADPNGARKFDWKNMEEAPPSSDPCRFCREGKDIEGAWRFGVYWKDSDRWVERTEEEDEEEDEQEDGEEEGEAEPNAGEKEDAQQQNSQITK
ncbi:hypothetical protein E8E13_008663 [Curvularia kusanoi]|uniref:Uncharacterized protein n=1 Tax=Curvularia kusanoi TaxID=90978 RepID=A0A9P4W8N8_CURKU|nr:hypothetical protein E8E13_008663 [Curvularia kusanoi]